MAEVHDGNFSSFVSKTLNNNGYSWESICRRRDYNKHYEREANSNAVETGLSYVLAGSSREGVCKLFGSDRDRMFVFDEVICREDFRDFETRRDLTIFEVDFYGCPPGYAHLVLVKHGGRIHQHIYTDESAGLYLQKVIEDSCCGSESGKLYFNSDKFMSNWAKIHQNESSDDFECLFRVKKSRAGPSLPSTIGVHFAKPAIQTLSNDTYLDDVPSFPCHCPSLFEKFRNRPRRHGWPSPDLLQELSQLDAHAVAVGDKMSEDHYLQWRLCFTQAEIRLIESLTEPQIHVFVLLKIFAKEVLKKTWDKMTSYVVKNVILWMAELTPARRFRTDTIVERFLDCLFFMKICVKANLLPNYMISDRNLLRHEHFIIKRKQLLSVLEECLYEKGCCLYKSETLKEMLLKMYSRPEVALQYGIRRDKFEQMHLHMFEQTLSKIYREPILSIQDAIRLIVPVLIRKLVLSGELSAFTEMIFSTVSGEELLRDPATAFQKIANEMKSYLV